jgi:hypothetical protein
VKSDVDAVTARSVTFAFTKTPESLHSPTIAAAVPQVAPACCCTCTATFRTPPAGLPRHLATPAGAIFALEDCCKTAQFRQSRAGRFSDTSDQLAASPVNVVAVGTSCCDHTMPRVSVNIVRDNVTCVRGTPSAPIQPPEPLPGRVVPITIKHNVLFVLNMLPRTSRA